LLFYRGFAKKTLLKTARKAGFKPKASSKRQKYVLPNMSSSSSKYLTSPGRMSLPVTDPADYGHDDNISSEYFNCMHLEIVSGDVQTVKRQTFEHCCGKA